MINMGAYTVDTETHVLSFRGCNEKTLGNTEFATLKRKRLRVYTLHNSKKAVTAD
ncbi:hypothetical protein [Segatella copri]|uniref:hypothetical protein n=1 Tax=Segatella copri TaxID=165179 RepID=UPI001290B9C7|nr:hypothetical protein [Segatella copri]